MHPSTNQAVSVITKRHPGFQPRVGLILGSGLGGLAENLDRAMAVPYDALPGFPRPGVSGHQGQLLLAMIGDTPVAMLQGRAHLYEDGRADAMAVAVRTLAALGCETLVLTNAAGGLDDDMVPGSLMLLTDHINFTGQSPLFGETGDDRFVDLTEAYDPALRHRLLAVAAEMSMHLHQGIYAWFAGPNFETPAEVRAAGILGANAVGMSTVPEVILARQAGMRVAALSIITNKAAGLGADQLRRLLMAFIADYPA